MTDISACMVMQVSEIDFHNLEPFDKKEKLINAIIETPKGSRNKIKFDQKLGIFKLSTILGEGLRFPYDFGFIPSTAGADGDPLDILLLMDEPTYPGILVEARPIGVVTARQEDKKDKIRNDRLIAVADKSILFKHVKDIDDMHKEFIEQLGMFFKFYNDDKDREFDIIDIKGEKHARDIVKDAAKKFEKK
jgi:inorganic pyrophosphatase